MPVVSQCVCGMFDCALVVDHYRASRGIVTKTLDSAAQRHALAHGLTVLRVECERDLFGAPVEVAVFRTPAGAELRRTADMLASAGT